MKSSLTFEEIKICENINNTRTIHLIHNYDNKKIFKNSNINKYKKFIGVKEVSKKSDFVVNDIIVDSSSYIIESPISEKVSKKSDFVVNDIIVDSNPDSIKSPILNSIDLPIIHNTDQNENVLNDIEEIIINNNDITNL